MPYAHKYANAATDYGMIGAVMHFMPDDGMLKTALRGGMSLARKDVEGLAKILVDMEMKMFRGLETPVIFLQNVVVDLLLGMGMKDSFRIFHDYVAERYGAEPGLHHHEPADAARRARRGRDREPDRLLELQQDRLPRLGRRRGLPATLLRTRKVRAIAMSVLASGAIPPREALEWVAAQPEIDAIVFGASSRRNIRDTKEIVDGLYAAA